MKDCFGATPKPASETPPTRRAGNALPGLNQAALSEIAQIAAGRALDHVDGEFEQTDLPGIVHALDNCAERFLRALHAVLCPRDYGVNRVAYRLLRHIGFAKLKSVTQHRNVARVFAQSIDIALRFITESFQQQMAEMFRSENLWTLGVNFSVPNPDLVDPVHQLGDEIEVKTRCAEGRDLLLRRENHLCVFNRVIEIVLSHHVRTKLPLCSGHFKSEERRIRMTNDK
jgi:hypothetical protein